MKDVGQKNKWIKYIHLANSSQLAPLMPETEPLTYDSFWKLLDKFQAVILKPVHGKRGAGVIKISTLGKDRYQTHLEKTKRRITGKENLYAYIDKITASRQYMVQQYIPLATIQNRPFDLRVIVQRRKHSSNWQVTGRVVKVAGSGYIVTNITRSRGKLMLVKTALENSSLRGYSITLLFEDINRVAKRSAERLSELFPRHRIYGLDMGLDQDGKVWIIETNLYPSFSHFLKLKNKVMYRRIKGIKAG